MRKSSPILYIVIPCFNEEECLNETFSRLEKKMTSLIENNVIARGSKIVFVDDGSRDNTWKIICNFHKNAIGLKLSRNRGHQNALLAGLLYAKDEADIAISMDADLQDDINAIDDFINKYNDGCEIVYGVRNSRKTDSTFKRNTALLFYKIMNWLGAETVYNSADYRLMSKRALEELSNYKEVNLFLRGIVPLLGFKTAEVGYARAERFAGKSKYPFKKMISFAWEGITSFSIKPIRMVLSMGVLVFVISLLVTVYSIIVKIAGYAVDGWTFIMCSLWLLGGIQMMSIGLVGEYIGKIYSEVKQRPRFIIEEVSKK